MQFYEVYIDYQYTITLENNVQTYALTSSSGIDIEETLGVNCGGSLTFVITIFTAESSVQLVLVGIQALTVKENDDLVS